MLMLEIYFLWKKTNRKPVKQKKWYRQHHRHRLAVADFCQWFKVARWVNIATANQRNSVPEREKNPKNRQRNHKLWHKPSVTQAALKPVSKILLISANFGAFTFRFSFALRWTWSIFCVVENRKCSFLHFLTAFCIQPNWNDADVR